MQKRFTYIWEFTVLPDSVAEFLKHYGPEGSWVKLFKQDSSYLETILLTDNSKQGRYITIDRWELEQDYKSFREKYKNEYNALDLICEGLTKEEKFIGSFREVD
jgi:hypothetical protein